MHPAPTPPRDTAPCGVPKPQPNPCGADPWVTRATAFLRSILLRECEGSQIPTAKQPPGPAGSPRLPQLPARCTLRFLTLPSPTPGTGIGGCYRIKGAWHGPAQHGPARPPGRAGKQAGPGRRQAGSTRDTSPKNAAAPDGQGGRVPGAAVHPSPGGPPGSPAQPAQHRGSPWCPRPDSRPPRRAGTAVLSGSPSQRGCGYWIPTPSHWV